ncbi:type II toxin-antitoxin system ParD family antitoxin [Mitsuaria sp. GD03876]|uniref:type II toxin-antitoxin system ParD family antitoxin n=1 Tax=Mitsuaria sp. GD03876 TaxID=2975399 RepID=UPI002447200A|nr:type II toxin-antitoxin system ParD family antitoxin [Mitsuaria sp. GD03876]MDH0864063.1 type II toxin-antitoxin system ParD family antitoxin [Mitsuaria sp. GD03876]
MIHADLGPELEAIVLNLIESGRYTSRTQVLRESEELQGWRDAQLREFDASIERGIADARAGKGISVEEAFETLYSEFPTLRPRDE